MFYEKSIFKTLSLYKLEFIFYSLIILLSNPVFAFDERHHKSNDAGINFQVRVMHHSLCSGSLLSKEFVLTAKHCIKEEDLSTTYPTVYYKDIAYSVSEVHTYGTRTTPDEDIAILKLSTPIIGSNINFVRIPTQEQEQAAFTDQSALTLFGFWGVSFNLIDGYANQYLSTDANKNPVDILPLENCPQGPNDGEYFCIITKDSSYRYPPDPGDSGGAVAFEKEGDFYVLGVLSDRNYFPRLFSQVHRDWLDNIYTELHYWGDNDRKGNVGDLYVYNNPYNNTTEYFGLVELGSDQRYWYFPIDKKSNDYWVYLGDESPQQARSKFDEILGMNRWIENDVTAKIGDDYVYINPYTKDVEIFTLKALAPDLTYWYFPINKGDNYYWSYKGLYIVE